LAQGTTQLSEAGAAAIAALLAMLRGPDDPAAQPSACGVVTVSSLCDLYMVRFFSRPRCHICKGSPQQSGPSDYPKVFDAA